MSYLGPLGSLVILYFIPIIGIVKRQMNVTRTVSGAKYILGPEATFEHKKQGNFCTKSIIFDVTDVTVWLKIIYSRIYINLNKGVSSQHSIIYICMYHSNGLI